MPRAYLFLDPQRMVEFLSNPPAGQEPISWKVHENGLPPDSICVGIETDGRRFRLELESADFIGGEYLDPVITQRTPEYTEAEMKKFQRPDPLAPENRNT